MTGRRKEGKEEEEDGGRRHNFEGGACVSLRGTETGKRGEKTKGGE